MKKIGIQTPCSEKWNEMTPTEKGAFCQKCAFEVHDFTNSTSEEIKQTLVQAMSSRVCARMTVDQERELRTDYLRWSTSKMEMRRISLFALIMVFGLSLFSCNTESDRVVFLSLQRSALEVARVLHLESQEVVQGEVELIEEELIGKIEEIKMQEHISEEIVMGMVAPIQETQQTIEPEEYHQLKGDVALPSDFHEYVEESYSDPRIEVSNSPKTPSIKLFPNPATSFTSIEVIVPQAQSYSLSLLDQGGATVMKRMYGELQAGVHYLDVDVSKLSPGVYFVYITTRGHKLQEKLIKY